MDQRPRILSRQIGAEIAVLILTLIAFHKGTPYGYYIFFRWTTCPLLAWMGWKGICRKDTALAIIGLLLSVINNPLLRISMSRDRWELVNIAIIAVSIWSAVVSIMPDTSNPSH